MRQSGLHQFGILRLTLDSFFLRASNISVRAFMASAPARGRWPQYWPAILIALSVLALSSPCLAAVSKLRQEEQVIFFPSLAYPVDKGTWEIQIHGCVFEPEKRPIGLFLLRLLL